jgi:hypothetical protein
MTDLELSFLIRAILDEIAYKARDSQRSVSWDSVNGPYDQALGAIADTVEYLSAETIVEKFRENLKDIPQHD